MRHIFILLLILVLFPTIPAHAQIDRAVYGEQSLTIDLEPLFPEPEESFIAKANDYSLPIQGTGISWYINGTQQSSLTDLRTINLTAPTIGKKLTLELVVDLPDGSTMRAKREIEPVYLDVIIEPQTRTPSFYQGRSLPSINSQINATALLNGTTIPPTDLLYTWRLNGDTLENGTVRGKNSVSFTMPRGQYATLLLEVRRSSGGVVSRRFFDIQSVRPELSFYEINPLFGLLTKTVKDSLPLVGAGVTVRAEPYYLDLRTYNDPDLLEWRINGTRTTNLNANPYEVTLATTEASFGGTTQIKFHVRNTVEVLQGVEGGFRVSN